MKRSPMPPRRTPLKRGAPPKAKKATPRKRSSARRRPASIEVRDEHAEVREAVFRRDRYRCQLERVPGAGRCSGPPTFHHRRKAGQGGRYTEDNGITLCASHNNRLESDADLAELGRSMGFVLKRGDDWTPVVERFWSKVDRDGPIPAHRPELGPCWLWTGAPNVRNGYGYFFPHHGDPNVLAHRFALGYFEALIDGLEVDHLCRNRLCVRPRHLEQVTKAENIRRAAEASPPPETCGKGHPMDGVQLGTRVDGQPIGLCLTCRRASRRAYLERKRAKENPDEELRSRSESAEREGPTDETASPQAPRPPAARRGPRARSRQEA